MHYYLTNFEIPENYLEMLERIKEKPDWITKVSEYSNKFHEIRKETYEKAKEIIKRHVPDEIPLEERESITALLSEEKEKIIQRYLNNGYTRETLELVLSSSFSVEEFIKHKKEIEIEEVCDAILRQEHGSFSAIGDIIDAIESGKFRGNLLIDNNGEKIKSAYGHGIKYYCGSNKEKNTESKFTEMIANYSSIIKAKDSQKIIPVLRDIIGDELFFTLDNFYKSKIMQLSNYQNENTGKTR